MIPIASPLPHAGRMYQSLTFISFFIVYLGVLGLYFFMWQVLLMFDFCVDYGIK